MLTRLYIDNYRCFVNFECRLGGRSLIFGRNGSGKSSLVDALYFVRQFAAIGLRAEEAAILNQRTRWLTQTRQTFELDATLDKAIYTYKLVFEPWGDPPKPKVVSETVHLDGKPIFEFIEGEVHLFNDSFQRKVTYPFDWFRPALATITARPENQKLTRFRLWLGTLNCFRLNPFVMGARAETEDLAPRADLTNFAAWYRHLVQAFPKQNFEYLNDLRSCLDGFNFLTVEPAGENVRVLVSEFDTVNDGVFRAGLGELSDGQRCLVCLYAILRFVIGAGGTVVIDEPDNFVALREIQPWLMAASDMVEEGRGQVLLASHHPEILNQWAPNHGLQFFREGGGPTRVKEFRQTADSSLTPAELIARGWEDA